MKPPAPVTSTGRPSSFVMRTRVSGGAARVVNIRRHERRTRAVRGAREPQRPRLPPGGARRARGATDATDVECLVVDSGSADASWEDVERHWPAARRCDSRTTSASAPAATAAPRRRAGGCVAFVNFDGRVEPGWDSPAARAARRGPGRLGRHRAARPPRRRDDRGGRAGDRSEHRDVRPARGRAARRRGRRTPVEVAAASGALMMVRRDEFLALGGFYEPLFMYGEEADYCLRAPGRVVLHPDAAIRHDVGHAAGPARSLPRLYHPARNRLVNAARHLPPLGMARAFAASAAFDVLTLAQVRRVDAVRAVLRGWVRGAAARCATSGTRAGPTSAARPRAGWSASARPWRSSVVWDACERRRSPARRAAAGCPTRPRSTAATGSTAFPATSRSTSARRAAAGGRCPSCRPSSSARSTRRATTPTACRETRCCALRRPGCSAGGTGARSGARRSPSCCAARRAGCSTSGAVAATSA